jgi:hypothetical protein
MATTPSGKTLSALETSTRRLILEEDATNSFFSSSEIADYINEGIRRLATDLEWQMGVFTASTVQDQSTYSLPVHIVSIIDVSLDGQPLTIVDRSDLPRLHANWLSADAAQPTLAYRADRDRIGVYPKPSATWAAKQMRIQAVKLPDTLVDSGDTPDIHIVFQDLLPFYAAFRCQLKAGNREAAADMLKLFNNGTKSIQGQLEKFADRLMAFQFDYP